MWRWKKKRWEIEGNGVWPFSFGNSGIFPLFGIFFFLLVFMSSLDLLTFLLGLFPYSVLLYNTPNSFQGTGRKTALA